MIRVLIVDDHRLVRQGIRLLLEQSTDIEVVGEGKDGREAVELAARLLPDIVLMDIDMPHLDGCEATRMICSSNLPVSVIVLSMLADKQMPDRARECGAQGYVRKDADRADLAAVIHHVYESRSIR